jgi:hypothetical protein
MVEYKTFDFENVIKQPFNFQTRLNLHLFCDIQILLALFCLLPLLEVVNGLIKFVEGRYVFICDFVTIVKNC